MNEILFPLLVVWPGIIGGAMLGAWTTHSLFGTGGHMDMSGLLGAFLGMPLGGGLSVYLAVAVGRWVDRRVGSQLTPAKIKRMSIAAGSCAGLGFLASVRTGAVEFPTFLGGWVGAVIGCVWCVVSDWKSKTVLRSCHEIATVGSTRSVRLNLSTVAVISLSLPRFEVIDPGRSRMLHFWKQKVSGTVMGI